ncbi:MAG: hypothetical protein LV479_00255 [Methylacidiphilales bacterium]|nr:hypothetical protein [Candidatus Methylacidiphilales bacterium]
MGSEESKSYQLRVRITPEEHALLEKLRLNRARGETVSDLVREAISILAGGELNGKGTVLNPKTQAQVERLAVLLKREPRQVEEACVEGILDLIEMKCDVPLIVMETHLHLKYRNRDEKGEFPLSGPAESEPKPSSEPQI